MKHLRNIICLAVALIPFACELPYAWQAIRISPAERWNWCFGLWAIVLLLAAVALNRRKKTIPEQGKFSASPLRYVLLLPGLMLLAVGYFRHIHLAILLGGILLPTGLAGVFYGWRVLLSLLPGCGVLMFFCPSIGIWLSTVLPLDSILLKFLLAILFTLLFPLLAIHLPMQFSLEKVLFWAIIPLLALGYWFSGQLPTRQPPQLPRFDTLLTPQFRGIQEGESERDRLFFGNSSIQRFLFQDSSDCPFHVLAVSKIDNIHRVHPTVYCLRVGGYRILSESTLKFPSEGNLSPLQVLELLVERNGEQFIFWQWYSSPSCSTPNFLLFRMLYSPKDNWSVFILDTPVQHSLEDSRKQLRYFLQDFLDGATSAN